MRGGFAGAIAHTHGIGRRWRNLRAFRRIRTVRNVNVKRLCTNNSLSKNQYNFLFEVTPLYMPEKSNVWVKVNAISSLLLVLVGIGGIIFAYS